MEKFNPKKLDYSRKNLMPRYLERFDKDKKFYFLDSTSRKFKELIRNTSSIHIKGHGLTYGDRYLSIPRDIDINVVGPIGLNLIYSSENWRNEKEYIELGEKRHKLLKKLYKSHLINESYNAELFELTDIYNDNCEKKEAFTYSLNTNITYEQWYTDIFIEHNYNIKVNPPGIPLESYRILINYWKNNIKNNKNLKNDKTFLKLQIEYIQELSNEINRRLSFFEDFVEGEKEKLTDLLLYLIKFDSEIKEIEKKVEIIKDKIKANLITYNKLYDIIEKMGDEMQELLNMRPHDNMVSDYNNINKIENAPGTERLKNDAVFTFKAKGTMPLVIFGREDGEEDPDKERSMFEQYFTIIIQNKGTNYVPHIIYLKDIDFDSKDFTSRDLLKLIKSVKTVNKKLTITFWSCLGFIDKPLWYNNHNCLGSSNIQNKRRSQININYNSGSVPKYTTITKLDRMLTFDDIDVKEIIYKPPSRSDYRIEEKLSNINLILISEAFLNTFRDNSREIFKKMKNFYLKYYDIIDDIYNKYKEKKLYLYHKFTTTFVYQQVEKREPLINEELRNKNFYLEIIYFTLYNYFKNFNSNKINIFNENIFFLYFAPIYFQTNNKNRLVNNNKFGGRIPYDLNPFRAENGYDGFYRNVFFSYESDDNKKHKITKNFSSNLDYGNIMICILHLFSKNIIFVGPEPQINIINIINQYPVKQNLGPIKKNNMEHKIAKFLSHLKRRVK